MPATKGLSLLFGFVTLLFLQCSTPGSTLLIDSWSNNDYQTTGFQKVLVVGIARRSVVREAFEYELKSQLKSKTVKVIASVDVMPLDEKIDVETFHKYFDDKNIDAVFVTRLVAVDELPSESSPGQTQYRDAASFYEHYETNYGNQAEEVMDEQNLILKVETNLYETKNEKKVWSCLSKSFQQGKTGRILGGLAKVIAETVKEDGFLKE